MSRAETAEGLKQALASAPRNSVGRAYPLAIRERATAFIERRRREGASDEGIGRELGISPMTFRRWVARRSASASSFMLATVDTPPPPAMGIVVHGPRGVRIEGLDLAGVAALLERLS